LASENERFGVHEYLEFATTASGVVASLPFSSFTAEGVSQEDAKIRFGAGYLEHLSAHEDERDRAFEYMRTHRPGGPTD
jgi:hypothetical protein